MRSIAVIALIMITTGCATVSPAKPIATFSEIAGTWEGRFELPIDGTWQLRLRDGTVAYDSMFWSGTLTLHEVEGRRILRDVAIQKRNGAVFTGEFTLKHFE